MYFWWIAQKDILLYLRDRRALLITIAMPLILIAILGAAFSNMFADNTDGTITTFHVGVANLDQSELSLRFVEDVLGNELGDIIHIEESDEITLREKVQQGKVEIGIIIQPSFSENLLYGETATVQILSDHASAIQIGIIECVLSQFGQAIQIQQKAAEMIQQQILHDPTYQNASPEQISNAVAEILAQQNVSESIHSEYFIEQGIHSENKVINAFQYYAVGMGVMFLLMAVVNGVGAMIEEKEDPVINRLLLTRMKHTDYLFGKLIGLLIKCGLQMAVIILGTHFIFGVDWGESIAAIFFIASAYVIGASGLGVLLGSFINKSRTLENAGMISVQIMAALGGSMVPLYIYPDWLISAAKVFPNALALQSFLDLMAGAEFEHVWMNGVLLLGVGALFMLLGWLKLRADGRRKFA